MRALALSSALLLGGCVAVASEPPSPYDIAITIDDLTWVGPTHPKGEVAANHAMIHTLVAHGVPATVFVNCDRVDPSLGILEAWRDVARGQAPASREERELGLARPPSPADAADALAIALADYHLRVRPARSAAPQLPSARPGP